jgi:(p)ppGpp synthase/HD superfamily hydrolase
MSRTNRRWKEARREQEEVAPEAEVAPLSERLTAALRTAEQSGDQAAAAALHDVVFPLQMARARAQRHFENPEIAALLREVTEI